MKKSVLIIAAVFIFGVTVINAQDTKTDNHNVTVSVPNFAILDIETSGGSNDITLAPVTAALEAGEAVDFSSVSNNELWLNYTAFAQSGNSRKVKVSLDNTIPGIDINLLVGSDAGNGAGAVGTVSGSALTLTTGPQDIITGIGTCYTGDKNGNGHQLTYSLNANDYSSIESASATVTVTYTIYE